MAKKDKKSKLKSMMLASIKLYGIKEFSKLSKLSLMQLKHLKKLLRQRKLKDLASSDDKNQLWQLIQLEKGITEQNWILIRQNEQMLHQNDEIIGMMKHLRIIHHKQNRK